MVQINDVYEIGGKRYRITGALSVGGWATTAIPEADPSNRAHTVYAQELKRVKGDWVPRTVGGKPLELQNDYLMGSIRRGEAVKL